MHIAEKPGKGTIFSTDYRGWDKSLKSLPKTSGLAQALVILERILIKPNLVEPCKPPITTLVALVAALVDLLRETCSPLYDSNR